MSSRASRPGKALHALKEWTLELFSENPVFIGGLSITPVVVGATTAANGLILGLAAAFLMLFLSGMCAMGGMLFRVPVQKGLAAFVSAAAFIPVGYVVDIFLPLQSVSLGIYLPLLCVSSIVVMKVPHALAERGYRKGFLHIVQNILGFFLCTLLVGIVREWLGAGTIFGLPAPTLLTVPSAAYPYMGFIIIGMLGAAAKKAAAVIRENELLDRHEQIYTEKWVDDSLDMEQPDAAEETSVAPEVAVEEQTDTAPLQAEPSAGQERPVNNQ